MITTNDFVCITHSVYFCLTDAPVYLCLTDAPVYLCLTDAPVLQVQIPMQVQEGQSVRFYCNLTGAEPAPYKLVRWKKDGVEFTTSNRSQPLVIDNVTTSQSGNYSCSRGNSVGRGESPAVAFLVECK